jgi:FKBP-type peptidyl-prolyl cis-trans isomerase FkpA
MRILFVIPLFFIFSCQPKQEVVVFDEPDSEISITKEESIEMHRMWVKDESYKIDRYIERHNWNAISTESGVRYYVYEKGSGMSIEEDMLITVEFEVRLIDSDTTLCYTSDKNGAHTFLVGMDNVESGLHEAVKYLHVGDRAYIILPHFAAHGLLGDMNKIPPLSTVLYDIYVVDAKNK